MNCQQCDSSRVVEYSAKTSDMNSYSVGDKESPDYAYVPSDFGIGGGGDYVAFNYCLDCGQIQGQFPLPPTEFESSDAED